MSTKTSALPPHPGDVLHERLQRLGVSPYRLGLALGTTPPAAYQLISTKKFGGRMRRSLTAQMALLLAQYFGDDPEYWMMIQVKHDLALALSDRHFVAKLAKVQSFTPEHASMLTGEEVSPDRRRARAPRKSTAATKKTSKTTVKKKKAVKSPAKHKE